MPRSSAKVETRVAVAHDGLSAELIVPAGATISATDVQALLAGAGLRVTPTDLPAIEKLLASAPEDEERRGVVLTGQKPVHGERGRVEWSVDEVEPAQQAQEQTEQQVSHYERSPFVMVHAGQVLGRVIAPTNGTDGVDVRGGTILAKAGYAAQIKLDESIMVDASGTLIAQRDGVLNRTLDKASIHNRLEIPHDVDFSTGNIDCDGDVKIHGGVRGLFTVKARGSIEVGGLIESATLIAGGDFIAHGGVAGGESGVVTVGGNCTARYLDAVELDVRGDLEVMREMINCRVVVHGSVKSPNASIIGGELRVTGDVCVAVLGSEAGTPTQLVLGSVPILEPSLHTLGAVMKDIEVRISQICEEMRLLEMPGRRLSSQEKERLTEVTFERSHLTERLARCRAARVQFDAKLADVRTVSVTINKTIHPGVRLVVANQMFIVSRAVKGPLRVMRDRTGELVYRRPDTGTGARLSQIAQVHAAA